VEGPVGERGGIEGEEDPGEKGETGKEKKSEFVTVRRGYYVSGCKEKTAEGEDGGD